MTRGPTTTVVAALAAGALAAITSLVQAGADTPRPAAEPVPVASEAPPGDEDEIERVPPAGPTVKEYRAELRTLNVGGVERTYRLYVPIFVKPGKPAPLVIVLHGARGHSEQIERLSGFNAVADREEFVVAYPQGVGSVWNDGREPELRRATKSAAADDVGFLRSLVAHLVAAGVADRARVHVVGESNGGFMAARLACEAGEDLAGVAILIASVPRSYRTTCNPSRPPPVLTLNGTEDRLVPWEGFVPKGHPRDGSIGVLSATEHAAFWAERNGCTVKAAMRLNDTDPSDQSTIVRTDWSDCKPGGATTFYEVTGGGHQTPSPRGRILDQIVGSLLGPRNRDVETSELVWDFFKRFKR